jgi:hypothetical protein
LEALGVAVELGEEAREEEEVGEVVEVVVVEAVELVLGVRLACVGK